MWMDQLVSIAGRLSTELVKMCLEECTFSNDTKEMTSAHLSMFLTKLIHVLAKYKAGGLTNSSVAAVSCVMRSSTRSC